MSICILALVGKSVVEERPVGGMQLAEALAAACSWL